MNYLRTPMPFLLWLTVLSVLNGCAAKIPKPVPSGELLAVGATTELLQRIERVEGPFNSVRALAEAELISGDDSANFRYALVYSAPDLVRIETLPTSAAYTLALLVANGLEFTFLDTTEKIAVRGDPTPEQIEELIGIPLAPTELLPLLVGRGAAVLKGQEFKEECYSDSSNNRILCVEGDDERFFIYAHDTLRLHAFELRHRAGKLRLRLEYHWDEAATQKLQLVKGIIPKLDLNVTLNFKRISENGEIPEALFRVVIPSDYEQK